MSISPKFYEQLLCQISFTKKLQTQIVSQLFHTKVLSAPFMCLQFGFVIFWQKDFGAKAAHKMLVKLTSGRKILEWVLIMELHLGKLQSGIQIFDFGQSD